jgi:hypothetical protein
MPDVDGALPEQIRDWAETCRGFVREALKVELDYTPDTLPLLDHYVRTNAAQTTEEVRDLLTPPLGAYFGEVVRRRLTTEGVRWHAPGEDFPSHRLEFEAIFLHFNPLGVALEVLLQEDAEGYGTHFQVLDEARPRLEEALSQHEAVSAADYYTFTMRYETLELVVSVLMALETQQQGQPRRFSREVYRAASGETRSDSLS